MKKRKDRGESSEEEDRGEAAEVDLASLVGHVWEKKRRKHPRKLRRRMRNK